MIESPYSGDIDRNIRYLDLALADSEIIYGESPYASHGVMTRHPRAKNYFVSDYDSKWDILTREGAISLSQNFRHLVKKTVFYVDRGWSSGMKSAKKYCIENDLPYEIRKVNLDTLPKKIPFLTRDFCLALILGSDYSSFLE